MILSLTFLTLTVFTYAINQLWYHGKLRWTKYDIPFSFWGDLSHVRKYDGTSSPPNNWYYRFFKIKYKERFLGSCTCFVALTDGMHFTQFFFFIFLTLTIVTFDPVFNLWIMALIYYVLLHISFVLFYKVLSK